jgi:site-specific recombinase XerD
VAESTEDDYVDTVRLHLVLALGRKRLAKLTVADLDRLWKAKRDAGYSSNSIRIMRTVLRRALGQAVREGIVARNVAGLSAAPRIRAKDGRTVTVDQARQLLEAAAGYRFEAPTCWPWPTGCAAGRCWACTGRRWTGRPRRWQ